MSAGGVVVAHPGRQHSHELARALSEAGLLAAYWAGVPSRPKHSRWIPAPLWSRVIRHSEIELPDDKVAWNPVAPAAMKVAGALFGARHVRRVEMLAYDSFDHWVARRLPRAAATVFVGYETATLESFEVAKSLGMIAVLDAASIHHRSQDRLHGYLETPDEHQRICRLKDAEIALADAIVTVSEVARDSYVEAGVPPAKVRSLSLGADLRLFQPGAQARRSGPFRFLFVGAQIRRKGIDLLLEAFKTIRQTSPDAELVLVGGVGDASDVVRASTAPGVIVKGSMTQALLAEEYRAADCFVLPSRNDSYGMVVAESLASGTPVIITDMVGAKDSVHEGRNGWVLETGNREQLRQRMLWCVGNLHAVRDMRGAAAASAAGLGWDGYHARAVEFYRALCASSPGRSTP